MGNFVKYWTIGHILYLIQQNINQQFRLGALPKLIVELGEGVVQWMVGGITRKLSILSLMILEESSKTKDFSPDMFRYFYH